MNNLFTRIRQLPTYALLPLILVGFGAGIVAFFSFMWATMFITGFASIFFVIIGILLFVAFGLLQRSQKNEISSLGMVVVMLIFASIGTAMDRLGNPIYNAPFQLLCPQGTSIGTKDSSYTSGPGNSSTTLKYYCSNAVDDVVYEPTPIFFVAIRFAEYVLLAFGLKSAVGPATAFIEKRIASAES